MKTSDLAGELLDYWVARALGYRFWLEKRGDYRLAVRQDPGKREPYKASRGWESQMDRYTEVFSFSDIKCGFFGVGVPKFSSDWTDGGPIIERERIELGAPCESGTFSKEWRANTEWGQADGWVGPTPLIAAMRAYVASKLGTDVPDETEVE